MTWGGSGGRGAEGTANPGEAREVGAPDGRVRMKSHEIRTKVRMKSAMRWAV